MTTPVSDRIDKQIDLKAPQARVWRAITDAAQFGAWFGVVLQGQFAIGESIEGKLTYPGLEHLTMEIRVVAMEAQRRFAFRWQPHATDPEVDYSADPTTLVEFTLTPTEHGTRLVLTETGFDGLPADRRSLAFRMTNDGWTEQMGNIEAYLRGA